MESKVRPRIIPVLTIAGNKLVKTIQFKNPKYLGDPLNAIKIFNDKQVDELIILDIEASEKKQKPNYDLLYEMAGEAFIPLGYGGGISSLNDAIKVFDCGFEKVVLNSVLHKNKSIISEIANVYGNQSVSVSCDVKTNLFGKTKLYFYSGKVSSSENIEELIAEYIKLGAGEIILNDVNREGTFKGYNLELIKQFSNIAVPIVALGGCHGITDMNNALKNGASAIAAASIFVYKNNDTNSILINYPKTTSL